MSPCKDIAKIAGFEPKKLTPGSLNKGNVKFKSPQQRVYDELRSNQVRDLSQQELISPFITSPLRHIPDIYINNDAEKARSRHDREFATEKSIAIYTDGSGIDGEIVAAAVCTLTQQTRSVYMGIGASSTVYAAELQGIYLALQIALDYTDQGGEGQNFAIYTDNQAAIQSITKAERRLGAYILEEIAEHVQRLQDRGKPVVARWIPARMGTPGNEMADKAAKKATG